MTRTAQFYPEGVCSKYYEITLTDGIIDDIVIIGGCHGNLQGIARLIKGRPAKEIADILEGVDCHGRGTSCPDQIAKALRQMI